jgi:hypothetical protein
MSAESSDKRMPSATAAFAGAVLGIDVCIAHMIGPDILISLLVPAGKTAERVSTGYGIIGRDWWRIRSRAILRGRLAAGPPSHVASSPTGISPVAIPPYRRNPDQRA